MKHALLLSLLFAALSDYAFITPRYNTNAAIDIIYGTRKAGSLIANRCLSSKELDVYLICESLTRSSSDLSAASRCIGSFSFDSFEFLPIKCLAHSSLASSFTTFVSPQDTFTTFLPYSTTVPFFSSDEDYSDFLLSDSSLIHKTDTSLAVTPHTNKTLFGTAISPSGDVSVVYANKHMKIIFHTGTDSREPVVVDISNELVSPECSDSFLKIHSVVLTDEHLVVAMGNRHTQEYITYTRVFSLLQQNRTVRPLTVAKRDGTIVDASQIIVKFPSSNSYYDIDGYHIYSCFDGVLAIDAAGSADRLFTVALTCPRTTYRLDALRFNSDVGSILMFQLDSDGRWLGTDHLLALIPFIEFDIFSILMSFFKTLPSLLLQNVIVKNGTVVATSGSLGFPSLYVARVTSADFKTGEDHTITLHKHPVNLESDDPTNGKFTAVGLAIAFSYRNTILVTISSGFTNIVMHEYSLTMSLLSESLVLVAVLRAPGSIVHLYPLGMGTHRLGFVFESNLGTILFAEYPTLSPGQVVDYTLVPSFKIEVPALVSSMSDATDFVLNPLVLHVLPYSVPLGQDVSFSNDRFILFNPYAGINSSITIGAYAKYNTSTDDGLNRFLIYSCKSEEALTHIIANEEMCVSFNTGLHLTNELARDLKAGTVTTSFARLCTAFTIPLLYHNLAYAPEWAPEVWGGHFLRCTARSMSPPVAGHYTVPLTVNGVHLAELPLTVTAASLFSVHTVTITPNIIRQTTLFAINVIPADSYGNIVSTGNTTSPEENPCLRFSLRLFNFSGFSDDEIRGFLNDWSTFPSNSTNTISGDELTGGHTYQANGKYCSLHSQVIDVPGEYLYVLLVDEFEVQLPTELVERLYLHVLPTIPRLFSPIPTAKFVLGVIIAALAIICAPILMYRCYNIKPDALFRKHPALCVLSEQERTKFVTVGVDDKPLSWANANDDVALRAKRQSLRSRVLRGFYLVRRYFRGPRRSRGSTGQSSDVKALISHDPLAQTGDAADSAQAGADAYADAQRPTDTRHHNTTVTLVSAMDKLSANLLSAEDSSLSDNYEAINRQPKPQPVKMLSQHTRQISAAETVPHSQALYEKILFENNIKRLLPGEPILRSVGASLEHIDSKLVRVPVEAYTVAVKSRNILRASYQRIGDAKVLLSPEKGTPPVTIMSGRVPFVSGFVTQELPEAGSSKTHVYVSLSRGSVHNTECDDPILSATCLFCVDSQTPQADRPAILGKALNITPSKQEGKAARQHHRSIVAPMATFRFSGPSVTYNGTQITLLVKAFTCMEHAKKYYQQLLLFMRIPCKGTLLHIFGAQMFSLTEVAHHTIEKLAKLSHFLSKIAHIDGTYNPAATFLVLLCEDSCAMESVIQEPSEGVTLSLEDESKKLFKTLAFMQRKLLPHRVVGSVLPSNLFVCRANNKYVLKIGLPEVMNDHYLVSGTSIATDFKRDLADCAKTCYYIGSQETENGEHPDFAAIYNSQDTNEINIFNVASPPVSQRGDRNTLDALYRLTITRNADVAKYYELVDGW